MARPRLALACAVLALATPALAAPGAGRKAEPTTPPRVREIAHRLFEEAVAAADEGKLDVAIATYRELERLSPHPNITFNLAALLEEQGKLSAAIEELAKYVAAQPDDASAAKHLAELRATPGRVKFEATTKYGVKTAWYVDGELVARDTQEASVPAGPRRITMISELGFRSDREVVEPGRSKNRGNVISVDADQRADGNVILDRTPDDRWGWFYAIDGSDRDDAIARGVHNTGRYTIPPGKHTLQVKDQVCDYDTTLVVGKDELLFLYFDRTGFDEKALLKDLDRGRSSPACGKLVVKRNVVKLDGKPAKR